MSIATELTALATNTQGILDGKADVAQAITSKGVPTADDASFDTLAINIGLITGGGGSLPTSISKIDGGSFVLDSDVRADNYWIEHNLGVVPTMAMFWTDELTNFGSYAARYAQRFWVQAFETQTETGYYYGHHTVMSRNSDGGVAFLGTDPYTTTTVRDKTITDQHFRFNYDTFFLKAGCTYKWIAFA